MVLKGIFGGATTSAPVKTEAPKVDPKEEFEDIVKKLRTTGLPNIAIDAEKFKIKFFDLATKAGLKPEEARDRYYEALEAFQQNKSSSGIDARALAKPSES